MSGWPWVLLAYLAGSISFSVLIVRAAAGLDVRDQGSGNAGATNVLRVAGRGAATAVLVLDVLKGVLPVKLAQAFASPDPLIGWAAVAVVLGHVFPVFFGFRGGKGVATAAGALSALAWVPAGLTALIFFALVGATRFVALASVIAAGTFPVLLWAAGELGWSRAPAAWLLVSSVVISLVVVAKHLPNLRRLREGTERRLGSRLSRERTP